MERRIFLKQTITGSALMMSGGFPLMAFADDPNIIKLTILHTNDVHSRIDPFPNDGSRNGGLGGVARRAAMIDEIKKSNENILLLDAGDIFQGTPYFNFFGGELEFKLMSKLSYDAATMGNHDFDAGIEGFDKQLVHANFPFIVSNYNFDNTILNGKVAPYKIFEKSGIKVGVIGTGIELKGLVPMTMYKDTIYEDPIQKAQNYATMLKKEMDCDYVICLSHLGYRYDSDRVSDVILAQNTKDIDLIIGGHTHTFMRKADERRNLDGESVIVTQAGWAGILLGHIDVYFERSKNKRCVSCNNRLVG